LGPFEAYKPAYMVWPYKFGLRNKMDAGLVRPDLPIKANKQMERLNAGH